MKKPKARGATLAAAALAVIGLLAQPIPAWSADRDLKKQAADFHRGLVQLSRELDLLTDLSEEQDRQRDRAKRDVDKAAQDWAKQAAKPDDKAKKRDCDYGKRLLEAIVNLGLPLDTVHVPGMPRICDEC